MILTNPSVCRVSTRDVPALRRSEVEEGREKGVMSMVGIVARGLAAEGDMVELLFMVVDALIKEETELKLVMKCRGTVS